MPGGIEKETICGSQYFYFKKHYCLVNNFANHQFYKNLQFVELS